MTLLLLVLLCGSPSSSSPLVAPILQLPAHRWVGNPTPVVGRDVCAGSSGEVELDVVIHLVKASAATVVRLAVPMSQNRTVRQRPADLDLGIQYMRFFAREETNIGNDSRSANSVVGKI